MPWDASLNNDAHQSERRHCVLSWSTLKQQGKTNDARKYPMATPELASQTYHHISDPDSTKGVAPTLEKILQDTEGVWKAIEIVYGKKGVDVPGLAEGAGRHYLKNSTCIKYHGGPCKGVDIQLPISKR